MHFSRFPIASLRRLVCQVRTLTGQLPRHVDQLIKQYAEVKCHVDQLEARLPTQAGLQDYIAKCVTSHCDDVAARSQWPLQARAKKALLVMGSFLAKKAR